MLSHVNLHGSAISVNFTARLLIFMSGVKGVGEGELTAYRPLQKSPALYLFSARSVDNRNAIDQKP